MCVLAQYKYNICSNLQLKIYRNKIMKRKDLLFLGYAGEVRAYKPILSLLYNAKVFKEGYLSHKRNIVHA